MVPTLSDETTRFFDYITFDLGGTFRTSRRRLRHDLAPIYGLDLSAGTCSSPI
jgi:hypothetical protein